MQNNDAAADRPRSAALWPLLISAGLVLGLAAMFYALYTKNTTAEYADVAARVEQERARLKTLIAEKNRLEDGLHKTPCEAKALLEGGTPSGPVSQQTLPAPAVPTASSVALLEDACVFIVTLGSDGSVSTGSGFFVAPGIVATNSHVIEGGNKHIVTSKKLGRPVLGQVAVRSHNNDRDYAVLRVKMPQGVDIAPLTLNTTAKRTEKVGAWGFPHVVAQNDPKYKEFLSGTNLSAVPELVYSEGVVSAVLERSPALVVHTAPISPGNSGGPLVNAAGEVVGINTLITLDEDSYRQASIALSAGDLAQFLQSNGVPVNVR